MTVLPCEGMEVQRDNLNKVNAAYESQDWDQDYMPLSVTQH